MMMLSDWTLSYNTINTDMNTSSDIDRDYRTSELGGVRPYVSNLIERILNLICTVECIKVFKYIFFNMLLYKRNAII